MSKLYCKTNQIHFEVGTFPPLVKPPIYGNSLSNMKKEKNPHVQVEKAFIFIVMLSCIHYLCLPTIICLLDCNNRIIDKGCPYFLQPFLRNLCINLQQTPLSRAFSTNSVINRYLSYLTPHI